MSMNIRIPGLLILIAIINIGGSCVNNCSKIVQFEIPISIYPVKETYHLFDTLWVEMKLNQHLKDILTGNDILVGYYNFQVDMNILELLDTAWIDGTNSVEIVPSVGNVQIYGITYPEVVPQFIHYTNEGFQKWKFGIVFIESNKELVLLFGKRDPNGWHGEHKFPEDNCIYGIASSTFLVNEGSINYEEYVLKYPFFTESGTGSNIAENHKNSGAFFI